MLDRLRNGTVSYWAIIAIAFAVFTAILFLLGKDYGYESGSYYSNTANSYEQAQKTFYEDCVVSGLTGKELIQCLEKKIETAREPQRAEEDLRAQKEMSRWALWLLIATTILSALALGVAAIGVIFVKRTLDANVKAVEAAEKQISLGGRPWLAVEPTLSGEVIVKDGSIKIPIRLVFRNTGHAPAIHVVPEMQIIADAARAMDVTREMQPIVRAKQIAFRSHPDRDIAGRAVFPGQDASDQAVVMTLRPIDIGERESVWPALVGIVTYDSPVDDSHHQTGFVAYVFDPHPSRPHGRYPIKMNEGEIVTDRYRIETGLITGIVD
ncbi:MAG: hypothetical protein KDJ88_05695 [Bauldia sp.]|nr:hypothetical protein [Bauldia sp.]